MTVSVALSHSVSEIRKNQYADVVFQMDRTFAISSLRVADEEQRLSAVVKLSAQAHAFVVGEVLFERHHVRGESGDEPLRHELVRVEFLQICR